MSVLPSPSKSPATTLSVALPHGYSLYLAWSYPSEDCRMYQTPVEGRHTAMSVLPSPS